MNERTHNLSDLLNPVFVKEMRQFFHNKLFLSNITLLLVGQLLLIALFLPAFRDGDTSAGNIFIRIDTAIMYLAVFITAAYGSMERFMTERSSRELDITNITLLSPWQIIGGKLAGALTIWLLNAALCLPFMIGVCVFCNLPLTTIFTISAPWIVPMLIMIQAALFCGATGKKWMYGVYLYFVFQVAMPIGFTQFKKTASSEVIWLLHGGGGLLFLFLFAAATAMITPALANRMFPLRLLLAIIALPILGILPFLNTLDSKMQMLICAIAMSVVSGFSLLAACDRDDPGKRVLARVPANPVLKLLHFMLSSNRCGGILLALLILGIFGAEMFLISFHDARSLGIVAFGVSGYALFYSGIGILINRKFPSYSGWGGMLSAAVILGLLPLLLAAGSSVSLSDIVTSPVVLFSAGDLSIRNLTFWIAPAASWLMGIHFIAEAFRKWRSYCRPE